MPTVITKPRLVVRDAVDAIDAKTDKDCTVTFTNPVVTNQTVNIGGVNYTVCTGTFTYSQDPITFTRGNSGKITFDCGSGTTPNWTLYKFAVLGNPSSGGGLQATAYAGSNGKILVTDDNTGAGTFNYGIMLINNHSLQAAGSDPSIINDGE